MPSIIEASSPQVAQEDSAVSCSRPAETERQTIDNNQNDNATRSNKAIDLPYHNNADRIAPVRVDVTAPPSVRDRQITRAVRLVRPDLFGRPSHTYASVTRAHRITIRQLGGGLSNHLYVAQPGEHHEMVLVRIHAEDEGIADDNDGSATAEAVEAAAAAAAGSDAVSESASAVSAPSAAAATFVDREVENRVLAWLSSKGLAPAFHGRFTNGRIEEFYDGYRPLGWDELALQKFAVPIARAMACLHGVDPPADVLDVPEDQRQEGEIWSRIEDWFGMARDADKSDDTMLNEWEWLKGALRNSSNHTSTTSSTSFGAIGNSSESVGNAASAFFRQTVFTHMDCQSLNILTPSEGFRFSDSDSDDSDRDGAATSKRLGASKDSSSEGEDVSIRLIDFEYAGINPRAVDIANTFCEHTNMNNLEPRYEEQYPTNSQQDTFLRAYITRANPSIGDQLHQIDQGWEIFLSVARTEVGKHTLISHIGWAIWAVAQSAQSTIEFDYQTYAKLRMDGYYYFKGWYWGEHG